MIMPLFGLEDSLLRYKGLRVRGPLSPPVDLGRAGIKPASHDDRLTGQGKTPKRVHLRSHLQERKVDPLCLIHPTYRSCSYSRHPFGNLRTGPILSSKGRGVLEGVPFRLAVNRN